MIYEYINNIYIILLKDNTIFIKYNINIKIFLWKNLILKDIYQEMNIIKF